MIESSQEPVVKRGEELVKKKAAGANFDDTVLINRLFLLFNGMGYKVLLFYFNWFYISWLPFMNFGFLYSLLWFFLLPFTSIVSVYWPFVEIILNYSAVRSPFGQNGNIIGWPLWLVKTIAPVGVSFLNFQNSEIVQFMPFLIIPRLLSILALWFLFASCCKVIAFLSYSLPQIASKSVFLSPGM